MKSFFRDKKIFFVYLIVIVFLITGVTYALQSTSTSLGLSTAIVRIDETAYGTTTFDASDLDFKPILDNKVETSEDNVIKIDFKVGGADTNNNENIIYDIALVDLEANCDLLSPYIKWKLVKDGEEISDGSLDYKFDTIDENGRLVLTTIQEDLPDYNAKQSGYDDYTFYMWLSDSCQSEDITSCKNAVDQSSLLGQNLSGKVEVELYTESKKELERNPENTLNVSKCLGKHRVEFINNGGTNSEQYKYVFDGETYGTLPTPTRSHTVTFNVNGGSDVETSNKKTVSYTFDGWYTDKDFKNKVTDATLVTATKNHQLYAKWSGNDIITLPDSTMKNYKLGGWYAESTFLNKVGGAGDSYQVLKDQTLYAEWVKNVFKLTLDKNGGTGGTDNIWIRAEYGYFSDADYTNQITKIPSLPSRLGYTFKEYDGLTDSSGTITASNTKYNDETTIKALWDANIYNISYTLNGGIKGTNAPASGTYDKDVVIDNSSKIVTITGNANSTGATVGSATSKAQTFAGWTSSTSDGLNTSTAKTGTAESPTTAWSGSATKNTYFRNLTSTKGATVKLTATWTPVAVTLPTVTKDGYTCGWSTEEDGTTIEYTSGGSYTPTATAAATKTMYAVCVANTTTITINRNDAAWSGSGMNVALYSGNTVAYAYSAGTSSGSTVSWSSVKAGTYNVYAGKNSTAATTLVDTGVDVTVTTGTTSAGTAAGTINYYVLTLNKGIGISTVTGAATYLSNQSASISATASTGYTFSKWTVGSGNTPGSTTTANTTVSMSKATTLTANATANTYTIGYTMNGGTKGTNAPTTGTYDKDVLIDNPTKTVTVTGNANSTGATIGSATSKAQTFAGWTSSSSAGLNTDTAKTGTAASPTIAWTGAATKNTYFRNLRTGSGTVTLTATWTPVAFNLPIVTKTGYTCTWNTKADGTGTSYNSGASYTPSATSAAAVTVYARCTANSYTITYNYSTNGGTSATKTSASVNYNAAIDLTPTATKSGWTFVGWNTSSTATTKLSSLTMGTSNVTLYAIFKKDVTVTFHRNNATSITPSGGSASTAASLTQSCTMWNTATNCSITSPAIAAPTNTPTVLGWNTTSSATSSAWSASTAKTFSANASYYAITTAAAKTVTITFYRNNAASITPSGGSASTAASLTQTCTRAASYNGTAQGSCNITSPAIAAPTNTPTVVGWGTSSNATSSSWSVSTAKAFTANASYYAITRADAKTVTITFNKNGATSQTPSGGSASTAATVTASCTRAASYNGTAQGTCNITSPAITRSGFTITGYNTSSSATTSTWNVSTAKAVSANATYYAITSKGVTVTFHRNNATSITPSGGSASTAASLTQSCTIRNSATTCSITSPAIAAPTNTPTVLGWNTTSSATSSAWSASIAKTFSANASYYAITRADAKTVTITFYRNNAASITPSGGSASTAASLTQTCTRAASYNGTAQGSCNITSPAIAAPTNTPTVVGWGTTSSATSSSWSASTAKAVTANASYYAITRADAKTVTVTFYRNNAASITPSGGSASTAASLTQTCTRAASYNGTAQGSCNITSPAIAAPTNTPTVLGWNTTSSATSSAWSVSTAKTFSANASYYAITTAAAKTVTITFHRNNAASITPSGGSASTAASLTQTCTRAASYNGTAQGSCNITSPAIAAPTNTPTVLGWGTSSSATSSSWSASTAKAVTANASYYAITRADAKTVTITFNKNGATSQTPSGGSASTAATVTASCTRAASYNGTAQGTCNITSPAITRSGFTITGYHTSSSATTSTWNVSTAKAVSANATYYAITSKGITITFNKNGATSQTPSGGSASTAASLTQSCTIQNSATTCSITSPAITRSGFTITGYNTSSSATTSTWNVSTANSVSAAATYYAITSKGVTVTFYRNNATSITPSGGSASTATSLTQSCTIRNSATNCSITSPAISAPTNTPTVLGWNTTSSATSSAWSASTAKTFTANASYYAITTKAAKTITITFNKNGATSQTPKGGSATTATTVTSSCTIAATYNGTAQGTTCSVTSPTFVKTGYTAVGYNTSSSATTSGWNTNTAKSVSANATYYAISRINVVKIYYNAKGGTPTASTTTSDGTAHTWTVDASGNVLRNGKAPFHTLNYGTSLDSTGLYNVANSALMELKKTGYTTDESTAWICSSGCSTANKVFAQNVAYSASDFCDSSAADCSVTLKANWRATKVNFVYNVNGGAVTSQTTASSGTVYNWTTDSDGNVSRNGVLSWHTLDYGKSDTLANFNNSALMNITLSGKYGEYGAVWECTKGCTTVGTTYAQSATYTTSDFCNINNKDCTVYLGVNWIDAYWKTSSPSWYFDSFDSAIDTVTDGGTITMQSSFSGSTTETIDKNITLNLNGKTWTRSMPVNINAGKTVNINGNGKMKMTSTVKQSLITNKGNLTITNGTFTAGLNPALINTGECIIKGGTFSVGGSGTVNTILNGQSTNRTGLMKITGGTFSNNQSNGVAILNYSQEVWPTSSATQGAHLSYCNQSCTVHVTGAVNISSTVGDYAVQNMSGSDTLGKIHFPSTFTGYAYSETTYVVRSTSGPVAINGGTLYSPTSKFTSAATTGAITVGSGVTQSASSP